MNSERITEEVERRLLPKPMRGHLASDPADSSTLPPRSRGTLQEDHAGPPAANF
jgi:hypothetical protein